jgi:hypothetical protein
VTNTNSINHLSNLGKMQIKALSGNVDIPIQKSRIRDFLVYHSGALNITDDVRDEPMPIKEDAVEAEAVQSEV